MERAKTYHNGVCLSCGGMVDDAGFAEDDEAGSTENEMGDAGDTREVEEGDDETSSSLIGALRGKVKR